MRSLYVICKIANSEYALPASDVVQMESYTQITPVPGAPAYVAGLIQVRQQVIPVVDARVRFGFSKRDADENSRFVILNYGARCVGLLVDSAREVRNFNAEDFSLPPEVFGSKTAHFIKAIAQIKDRIIMSMDVSKVLGEEIQHGKE